MPAILLVALRNWKLIAGGLALAGLAIALLFAKADARHWKKQAEHCRMQAEITARQAAEATAAAATRVREASDAYAERAAALQPIIVRSTYTVRTYAETPAGRARCLDADRVRGIDALDAALRDPRPAGDGAGTVPVDPGAPPG